jgi:hypothetical protein
VLTHVKDVVSVTPCINALFSALWNLYSGSVLTLQRVVCFQTFVNYTPFSRSKSAHVFPGLWQYVYPAEANDGSHGHTVTNLVFLLQKYSKPSVKCP